MGAAQGPQGLEKPNGFAGALGFGDKARLGEAAKIVGSLAGGRAPSARSRPHEPLERSLVGAQNQRGKPKLADGKPLALGAKLGELDPQQLRGAAFDERAAMLADLGAAKLAPMLGGFMDKIAQGKSAHAGRAGAPRDLGAVDADGQAGKLHGGFALLVQGQALGNGELSHGATDGERVILT